MDSFSLFLILIIKLLASTHQSVQNNSSQVVPINYDLSKPDKIYVLPYILNEISGITETDGTSIACIQDNSGILFIYDLKKEQITIQDYFYDKGDYEGIARADNTIYVLRSDGLLFEIAGYMSSNFKVLTYSTGIPALDNEGLCYDQKAGRLLIAPKSIPADKSDYKKKRFIYAFNLKSKELNEKPAFTFELPVIKKFVLENKIHVTADKVKKGEKHEPIIEFRPSAIGIDPITNRLFVISGAESLLYVFNMNGTIEYMKRLKPDIFPQPEGITFLKNGDMLISNEGHKEKPTIVRFNFRGKLD